MKAYSKSGALQKILRLSLALLFTASMFSLASATEIESGHIQATSTGTITENIGFRPDYIEFITAQQIESLDFSESDPTNNDCPDNTNGWSEGSVTFNSAGVDKQFAIGMFRNSDSTNGHRTASSTSDVIKNIYTSQDGNHCGTLEISVVRPLSNGFEVDVEKRYSQYDEIVRYKAYQFPDNMEFDAGMVKIDSTGQLDVNTGFQPANLHIRAGQQISSKNSVNEYWRAPMGRSKGYATLDEDGNLIDQQSIGTASSSDSTNAHRSIASDEYVLNTVYVDQNANVQGRLRGKITGADSSSFSMQVDDKWSGTDEVFLYRAFGFSYYDFKIGYEVISSGTNPEIEFSTGFRPDAIDIYAEQQIESINNEVTTPRNNDCSNAGGWSNGFYETDDDRQWSLSTGRTSDSQNSHRYGSTTSNVIFNKYSGQNGGNCGEFTGTVTGVTDDGFNMEFEHDSGFENNYGNEMVYFRAFNFRLAPPQVESIEFYNSTDEHAFGLVANITEGSNDVASCEITAESSNGNSQTYSGTAIQISDTRSQCIYEWIEYDDHASWEYRHDNNNELINLDVTVEAGDVDGLKDDKTESHKFPNHKPESVLDDDSLTQYNDRHAFNISADLTFPDDSEHEPLGGESSNRGCKIFLEGENGNKYDSGDSSGSGDFDVDFNYRGSDYATCEFSRVEPNTYGGLFDFEVWEEIEVTVMARDHHGEEVNTSRKQVIPNRPPIVSLQSPSDNSLELERDAGLEVFINDPEGDDIEEVEFINDATDQTIETKMGPNQGTYSVEWEDLDLGTYEWRVNASDPYDSQESNVREFYRVISEIYRVQQDVEHDYSSVIVDEDDTGFMFLETSINTDAREFTTYLEGDNFEAEFMDNGQSSKTYNLEPGTPKRHQIRINGGQVGNSKLTITTQDDSVDVNTSKTFPVYVRESVEEGQPVPGLTSFYMLIIALVSATLYFSSL